jgi:hypothetical protein
LLALPTWTAPARADLAFELGHVGIVELFLELAEAPAFVIGEHDVRLRRVGQARKGQQKGMTRGGWDGRLCYLT